MSIGTVFPVGHYCGIAPRGSRTTVDRAAPDQDAYPDQDAHLVRVGRGLECLTDDEFGIWVLAHGLDDVDEEWTRNAILDRAAAAEIDHPVDRVDELLGRGLLASVPTQPERSDESAAFAAAYRAGPLLVGLGTVAGRPDHYAIGVPGVGTAALLDQGCYELWQQSAVAPTLWRLCQDRVARVTRAGTVDHGPGDPVDPAPLLTELLRELRVLIVHGCAYLDVAPVNDEAVGDGTRPGAPGETAGSGSADPANVAE